MVLHLYETGEAMYVKPELVEAVLPATQNDDSNIVIVAGREYKVKEKDTGYIIFTEMHMKTNAYV